MSYDDVPTALAELRERISASVSRRSKPGGEPRLVAVSKLHPKEAIISAYNAGQRVFGENYVQELIEKANDPEIRQSCPDIQWHLIGHLQSNKVNLLVNAHGLSVVETVDSEKLAMALEKGWSKTANQGRLKVMVQVNTSGEENKSGASPCDVSTLVSFIKSNCPKLEVIGLMTIGAYDYDVSLGPNPDFVKLLSCHKSVCDQLSLNPQDLELSMGMSADFEHAIELGSTNIRVGTTIFGRRPNKH